MSEPTRALIVGQVATDESPDDVEAISATAFPRAQLRTRFGSILLGSDATPDDPARSRLLAHNCAVHLVPGGSLAVSITHQGFADDLAACGFDQVGGSGERTFWRRTDRRTVHDITAAARLRLDRLTPEALADMADMADDAVVIIDLRIPEDRRRHGVIPGSVAIPRSVLEWRADPTSGYPHERRGGGHGVQRGLQLVDRRRQPARPRLPASDRSHRWRPRLDHRRPAHGRCRHR